jgi:hypothetical protein
MMLPAALQRSIQCTAGDVDQTAIVALNKLADRVCQLEAFTATLASPSSSAASAPPAGFGATKGRPQTAPADGQDSDGAVPQARKVAIQNLVELAMGDLEGKLVQRVLERCGACDEALKRCALPPATAIYIL